MADTLRAVASFADALRSHASDTVAQNMPINLFHIRFHWLATLVAVLPMTGCGGKTATVAPVNGKVLLDGHPLTTGQVLTIPVAGRGSKGDIQPDGSFELSTYGDGDGALIGTHQVAVAVREPSTSSSPEAPLGKLLVPEKYTNALDSGLTIEVKADGENAPVLELQSK